MRYFRSPRWLLLLLLAILVPASSYAGVFISVGFAPPVLPVYDQPPCPEPGLMWTPGYWSYGDDGYYWVPGAWVPVPYEGALWTPPYWGWSGGIYVFHPGYWGPHVGYYGGVNYGFGYMGVGFVGGMWRGHDFVYNTAIMHVNERFVHNTYADRAIVDRYTIARGSRVAFSGGPGGIRHEPMPEERMAERERHVERNSFQAQHEMAARSDHGSYFKSNGGRPQTPAVARPLGMDNHGAPGRGEAPGARPGGGGAGFGAGQGARPGAGPESRPAPGARPAFDSRQAPGARPGAAPDSRPAPGARPASGPGSESRPAPGARPTPGARPAPAARPQSRPAPQHEESKPR